MSEMTILLVEDDPNDELLTLRELRRQNVAHEIIIVRDGTEALEYLFGTGKYDGRDPRDFPTLMLLDLKLPKIDGLEVLRRVRADKRTKMMPVVVLTSSDDQTDKIACYDLGANSYIRKPVDIDQFRKAVYQLHLYWMLLNEPPPKQVS